MVGEGGGTPPPKSTIEDDCIFQNKDWDTGGDSCIGQAFVKMASECCNILTN